MNLFGAFTFAFRGRAAGVALADVKVACDGGELVEGGRIDRVVYVLPHYIGEGPQFSDCRRRSGTR